MIRLFPKASKGLQRVLSVVLLIAGGMCVALACGDSPSPAAAKAPAPLRLRKVDVHLHVDLGVGEQALAILQENGVVLGLNASGGEPGPQLDASLRFARAHGDRLLPLCNFRFSALREPDFPSYARLQGGGWQGPQDLQAPGPGVDRRDRRAGPGR